MKKILRFIGFLVLAFTIYSCAKDNDKLILQNFANKIVDDSNLIQDIVSKDVQTTPKGKKMAEDILNLIRAGYKKKQGEIVVYSNTEYKKNKHEGEYKLNEGDKLYYIKFNDELILPFVVNKNSKIVVLLVITKGDVIISNSRSDE